MRRNGPRQRYSMGFRVLGAGGGLEVKGTSVARSRRDAGGGALLGVRSSGGRGGARRPARRAGSLEPVCSRCVRDVHDDVRAGLLGKPGSGTAVLNPDDLIDADALGDDIDALSSTTAEQEFVDALRDEIGWVMDPTARSTPRTRPRGRSGSGGRGPGGSRRPGGARPDAALPAGRRYPCAVRNSRRRAS
ncbi:MAG: hypothetical protein ACR2GH_07625 [Pseudonocardia sp.]